MEICRGNIHLKRVKEGDIESIRQWRNSEEVNRFMEYREHITAAMQEKWFPNINNDFNLYFIIKVEGKPIGLIYGAEINWEKNTVGNAGIFIAEENNREKNFATEASVLLNDFAFAIGLEMIFIKVLSDNKRAIAYNKLLGYQLLDNQESNYNQQYVLKKQDYNCHRKKIALFINCNDPISVKTSVGLPKELVLRLQTFSGQVQDKL